MFDETQLKALALLKKYLATTPESEIREDIRLATRVKSVGPTVDVYFDGIQSHLVFSPQETDYKWEPSQINLTDVLTRKSTISKAIAFDELSYQDIFIDLAVVDAWGRSDVMIHYLTVGVESAQINRQSRINTPFSSYHLADV